MIGAERGTRDPERVVKDGAFIEAVEGQAGGRTGRSRGFFLPSVLKDRKGVRRDNGSVCTVKCSSGGGGRVSLLAEANGEGESG